ncbi:hypothetical protein [Pedobacter nyackensis]|uniref:hypothetical protein n=1 Tax=Pedobacter nyackensis TaxID=475255 RepID=UPI002931546E|nr:hypothetical protein [Pedobacter nyackensis]
MKNYRSELEELQYNCKMKAMNIKTAMETAINDGFNDAWIIQNYISCVEESADSVRLLLEYKARDL